MVIFARSINLKNGWTLIQAWQISMDTKNIRSPQEIIWEAAEIHPLKG